ncbi:MAG: hypothetical protein EOM61_02555 [Bacteroidia bacterium]|uniref:Uncharacterized protein n=1 Tax=bioreactor metagenome TaxID=1076179 RepID=A0A644XRJ4_9ZZZZ|nr:hypothetical protein [Rikenellaceae bacterium]NCB18485.1 hypothetical protein [Bacteroidia bacterium]
MFFKEYIQKKALKKLDGTRISRYVSVENIESVGFIFNLEEENILDTIKKLVEILDKRDIKFKALAINRQNITNVSQMLDYRITVLNSKNFKYADVPQKSEIEFFTKAEYTTFIDFGANYSFANEYISKASRAIFKIGRVNYQDNPYDLLIDIKDGNHRIYLNSLIHYLSSIKSS